MKSLSTFVLLFAFAFYSGAEESEDRKAGHSVHGETFNEGPRQQAVLLEGMPDIDFPVTTKSKEAQAFFNQGVGQLHGFWTFEAERSFRQVQLLDPDCAMAYWGMAMANFSNKERAPGLIAKATERKEKVSKREQEWIDALAEYFKDPKGDEKKRLRQLVRAHEKMVRNHPNDVEAKAFLLHRIWANSSKKLDINSHLVVDLLSQQIVEAAPNHPAHHYRIHLWDKEDPSQALNSAAALGPTGPGIAHLWHMPGHIYSKLHRYADAAWQQEASARVDHAHMMRYRLIPDEIHNFAHNNEWCIRNMNYVGRVDDSIALAKNMISLPREPEFSGDTWKHGGSSWEYGRIRLRDTLMRFEMWGELLRYANSVELAPGLGTIDEKEWQRFTGIAAFETGKNDLGRKRLAQLKSKLVRIKEERDAAVADAEKKNEGKAKGVIKKATDQARANFKKKVDPLQNAVNELTVYRDLYAVDPPNVEAALKLIPDLKTTGKARMAQLYQRAGNNEKAIETITAEVKSSPGQVHPLAVQVEIFREASQAEEADKALKKMQEIAADVDLVAPIFQRLALANEWKVARKDPGDLGERPAHDSLGPFRWSPQKAPEFTLPQSDGTPLGLSDFSGKPVLVIFYLGSGCTHCMEQLQAFAPKAKEYEKAGISIVAVSTDSVAGLADTFIGANYTEENPDDTSNPFPFPLVSDEKGEVFKDYHAWDSFENEPLHGTFLIDGAGLMRWKDISWEPFMKADWLLEECERLLAIEPSS